ncbi:unnamed protein product [Litomosoides sigmodontis]|uniref:Uncharacterized protein n=1 Tax=Litomosoides sigmodontis TaxID=42156 RepID=A0A3P6TYY8_LITSI|nr:unnamed protein product [Litomosoides sigmodontis]
MELDLLNCGEQLCPSLLSDPKLLCMLAAEPDTLDSWSNNKLLSISQHRNTSVHAYIYSMVELLAMHFKKQIYSENTGQNRHILKLKRKAKRDNEIKVPRNTSTP